MHCHHSCLITILCLALPFSVLGASLSPHAKAPHPREGDFTFSLAELFKKGDDEQFEAPIDKPLPPREFPQSDRRKQSLKTRNEGSENWHQNYQTGRRRYSRFLQKYTSNPIPPDSATINLNANWDLQVNRNQPFPPLNEASALFPYINTETDRNCRIMDAVDKRERGISSDDLPASPIHFENMYCPNWGIIVAQSVYKHRDQIGEALDSWSDVAWAYWKYMCTQQGIVTSSFTWYIGSAIGSEEVIELLPEILEQYTPQMVSNQGGDPLQLYTISDTDADFIALFGLGQFNSLLWLLTDHMLEIGHKRPRTIYIFRPLDDEDDVDCEDYMVTVAVHVM